MTAFALVLAVAPAAGPPLAARAPGAAAGLALVGAGLLRARSAARRRAAQHHLDRRRGGRGCPSPPGDRQRHGSADALLGALVPDIPEVVARRLGRAGLAAGVAERSWRWFTAAVLGAVAVATVVGGWGGAALVVLVVGLGLASTALALGDRAAVLVDRELPNVLATVAAGMRSGASLTVAVREGAGRARGPAADDLRVVVDSLAAGRSLVEVLDAWVRARPTPGVRMAGAALALAAETGGAGARTIDGVAATLRDRLAVERELAALSSQARASAAVIGVAPIGFVVLTAMSDPGVWDFFLRTPAGLACLAAGGVLDAVGASWMMVVARGAR